MFRVSWVCDRDRCFEDVATFEAALRLFLSKRVTFPCRNCSLTFVPSKEVGEGNGLV